MTPEQQAALAELNLAMNRLLGQAVQIINLQSALMAETARADAAEAKYAAAMATPVPAPEQGA
jgi:hypothetical protein